MKALILILVLVSVSFAQHGHSSSANGTENTPTVEKKPAVWLDDGLGTIDHPVTTKSAEAQKYFNQGLAYMFAFNHAEGINSFKHAAELDPNTGNNAASQVVVQVAAGRFCEVTAVVHVSGSNRAAVSRGNSLHLYFV